VDFLTLNSGQKFELPFMTLVAFATNIRPQELVDEAFLRRIHYKVLCESPTHEDYIVIFRNYCRTKNVAFNRELVEDLLENYYKPRQLSLRGCHPRDLIEQSLSLAEYLGQGPELTPELLRAACDSTSWTKAARRCPRSSRPHEPSRTAPRSHALLAARSSPRSLPSRNPSRGCHRRSHGRRRLAALAVAAGVRITSRSAAPAPPAPSASSRR
jgi:hypothetical protein